MKQTELVQALDTFFNVSAYQERENWHNILTEMQRSVMKPFIVPTFWDGLFNGLMVDCTEDVNRIYLVVFPNREVLDTIIAKEVERGAPGALIFAHHPLAFEESGAGFLPIPAEQLEELNEHNISYYSCHAPLDCHAEISTGSALAKALLLDDVQRFAPYFAGYAGVYGTVSDVSFNAFAQRVAEICELSVLRYDQVLHNARPVNKVAIVAGGGGNQDFINEAMQLEADTYVTGHWHLFAPNEFSKNRRQAFAEYIPKATLNLLGTAHYSSEMVVMRDQLPSWFESRFDLEAILVRQDNPWG